MFKVKLNEHKILINFKCQRSNKGHKKYSYENNTFKRNIEKLLKVSFLQLLKWFFCYMSEQNWILWDKKGN